jgi:Ca-activated chloride channel family protein
MSDFTNSPEALLDGLNDFQKNREKYPEIGPKEDRELGTAFYDSIYYSIAEKMVGTTGRRALLLFSDGEDNSSSHDMMTTLEEAQAANTRVYTIRYTEKDHGKLTARNQYGIHVMDRIAKDTGAQAIDAATTDPRLYFQQIAGELRYSYELAYYPTDTTRDGTFRKIVLKPRRDGLTLRARTGYLSR